MEKHYRIFVTNTDLAISVLTSIGIPVQVINSYLHFSIEEQRKNDTIIQLNKGKVVIYDIEEL
ncbi:MAG: hypothetical protein ABS942_12475 [Solibacillus sp.]|uniref:hypothetical protein n=1 Tax=unclassified Solibacillus TaxID=2637870 RepID=UPI003101465C